MNSSDRVLLHRSEASEGGYSANWVFPDDNAPLIVYLFFFFGCTNTTVAPDPPYSPALALCDFLLFPKIKFKLRDCHSDTVEEIQCVSQMVLDALTEQDFQGAFQVWL